MRHATAMMGGTEQITTGAQYGMIRYVRLQEVLRGGGLKLMKIIGWK
jgi:hypothetical protein